MANGNIWNPYTRMYEAIDRPQTNTKMKQKIVIEISKETFERLLNTEALDAGEAIIVDTYPEGEPEIVANLKLIASIKKEASATYRKAMQQVEDIEAINDQFKEDNDG